MSEPRRAPDTPPGPLRIAHVAPVATTIPPPKSGSVEQMTSLRSSPTVTGTTSTCGHGRCTRC